MKSASRKTLVQLVQKSVGLSAGGQGCCGPRPAPRSDVAGASRAEPSPTTPDGSGKTALQPASACCAPEPASTFTGEDPQPDGTGNAGSKE